MTKRVIDQDQARLAALYDVSAKLGESLDLPSVLTKVMDALIELTGAERGFLMLQEQDTSELIPQAARNIDKETLGSHEMQISRTVVDHAIKSGEGILTNNAQQDSRFADKDSIMVYNLRSIMCAPLMARGRKLGAMYVDNRLADGVFNADDLELMSAFANQAAIAIENAHLFAQTDELLSRRVGELSMFQRIDQQLNQSLDLNYVLELSLKWAIALTNADSGTIGLMEQIDSVEQEQYILRLLVYRGENEQSESKIVPVDHPVLAQVVTKRKSVLTQDVAPDHSIDGTPAKVQLAVPIKRDGLVRGLIALESQTRRFMGQEDIAFVERLADRAGVAIKNAQLYKAIQDANRAKSEFISVVTHELRLPMTSIRGYADLISSEMSGPLNDQQKQFLAVIRRNLDRMGDLIRDLADINRIESGRIKFENQQFDMNGVVADVVDALQERIDAKEQTLTLNIQADLPALFADPKRMAQVLSNLVSNANKYTPAGGQIDITIEHSHDFVVVSVSDNGIGISKENQQKLFTQFFRAEDTAVREQPGWGLGLSIVKKIVEAQGGEISFVSEYNKGTTFSYTIPTDLSAES